MHLQSRVERGILTVDMVNPPVNCLSLDIRRNPYRIFTESALDPRISAIVLSGMGKYFCAGGDLREIGTTAASAESRLSAHLLQAIERCPKPNIAAIHGATVGGGFELALACHYRVAPGNARISLPEIRHGIIPLSGTIRLPRLWAVDRTLSMILRSTAVTADKFRDGAVFDCLVPCIESNTTFSAISCTRPHCILWMVKHWMRNIERQERFSFWLPTATDYFYPDFVAELTDGRLLVVEYKGEPYKTNDDSREKMQVGHQWEKSSNGRCLFLFAVADDEHGRTIQQQIADQIA